MYKVFVVSITVIYSLLALTAELVGGTTSTYKSTLDPIMVTNIEECNNEKIFCYYRRK